jgi:AcrR family transcriptional regulator
MSAKRAPPRRRKPGPVGGARDTNRKAREETIRDAALLLYLQHGLDAVSVDDVMRKARMAKSTFYRYFDTQAALVESLMKPAVDIMLEALELCSVELESAGTRETQFQAYRRTGDVMARLLLEYPGQVRLYLQESRAPANGARVPITRISTVVSRYAVAITQKAQAHGILKPIPVAVSALTVVGAIERLLLAVLQDEDVGNPLELPLALTKLILDGLKS